MTATKLDLVKVEDWGLFTDTTKPIIIAGPCSAESEQQVFETAKGLKAAGVEVLRAGNPVPVRIVSRESVPKD